MSGINTLKIKYTTASGYFIEVSLSQKSKVPEVFIYKTALINALRYTTEELSRFEAKISNAQNLLFEREYAIFKEISQKILQDVKEIKKVSSLVANVDYLSNMAFIAYENNYTKPEITSNYTIEIVGGRHPVIEKIEKNFISNELFLDKKSFIHIIT
jgi:DNA mismatch repair protein MutS